ncbi:MAG: LPS-assembly protein LptD [Chitinophagaceae bacterium]|nr:LPS-assembly protein LptD [Chitinophagaceae bacterium]
MSKLYKINGKSTLAIFAVSSLLILTFYVKAGRNKTLFKAYRLTNSDTAPVKTLRDSVKKDSARFFGLDTARQRQGVDSVAVVDTLKISKDSLDVPVRYHADDSAVLIVPTREFFLYGKARTEYKDIKLEAGTIHYDQQSQLVTAFGSTDTTGSLTSKPKLTQGDMTSISDTIVYNLKSTKARTINSYFQEGEIFVNAKQLKKVSDSEFFASDARFTTCNLDNPHFAFRTRRLKMVTNKIGVTGRIYPEIESVPIPLISLPFSIFPLYNTPHSGVLFPAFTASEDFGLGLEGLGYYYKINDYVDVTTRTNLYSYGGWMLNLNSKYIRRYKFTGNVNVTLQNSRTLNRGIFSKDEYSKSQTFMINWSHSRDNRARPGTNFSANVNFGSTKFNQLLQNNPFQNYNNQLSSSISYSKTWDKYNLSLNLNHNQNSVTRLMNLNLPTAVFNVVTLYPFAKKDRVGSDKWYEKIGVGYSGNFQNQISFYDTAFNIRRLLDTLQWGAVHNVPITLSLPSLGPFLVTPGVSYEERWYGQRIFRNWDSIKQKVDTVTQRGFYAARQMSFGLGINTRIFGTYRFKNSRLMAIRHEIRPTISINYKPDFVSQYFYTRQVDTSGRKLRFSQFDGGIIGSFSEGQFGGISFGVDNLLEMKVRDKDTSNKKGKNIKLIDGFGFNSSYNLLADSFALGIFSLYARSTLFEKINITAAASLDPYDVDKQGYRVNRILWDPGHFKFGRLTSGSLAISTSFSSKSKDGKDDKDRQLPVDPFMTPDEQQRQLQFARANPAEFTDFNIPWTLALSYSFNFTRVIRPDFSGFETQTFSSVNFNGDFSLTPKWKVGGNGYYDFATGKLQQLAMFISREMHCWQLSINVTPIGLYRSFNIVFSPKSGILRDLKINRSRTFTNY